jgi:phenylacetate-CoA ligase
MRPEQLEQVQLERLQALLARLKRNVRRYRELLGNTTVNALADLPGLPVTSAADLLDAFPYGMFALPLREVVRLHSAVGPAGRQLVCGYTRNDLENWARLVARQLAAAGVTTNDVLQICFGGVFLGQSLGYTRGAELAQVAVIPEDTRHIEYQFEMLRNYRTTVLITTPSNARDIMELLGAQRLDPQSLHLRTILLTRPVPAAERQELEAGLFAKVRCNFGIEELMDPGFCVECDHGRLHVNEDQFLVECVNGELLVTTLCREAMPLLRYRTRRGAALTREKCPCGRTGTILVPGERLDGCLRVNEMPLYREQVSEVLAKTRVAGQPFSLEIGERFITVAVEISEACFADEMRQMVDLRRGIQAEFLARLGIRADIRYVAPGSTSPG